MRFVPVALEGAFVIELERHEDERGYFARTFCRDEFARMGLCTQFTQGSLSCNRRRGTLRGMHFQAPPHEEHKLVSCVRGRAWDVVVDLRRGSATFGRHAAVELSGESGRAVYVPAGFAHGFQALEDDTVLAYQISVPYEVAAARGVHHEDPRLGIAWPIAGKIVSERDLALPGLDALP